MILKHAVEANIPHVICGDLNDTPFSFTYKLMTEKHADSFQEVGQGIGSTYAGLLPGLRIDYIFAEKNKMRCCLHQVWQAPFSDHLPVSVHLRFLAGVY